MSGSSPRCERRHQPRHDARADVLERQRRTVKQLERVDARLDFDERNREVQRRRRRPLRASPRRARRGERPQRAQPISVSVRRGSRASSRRPRLDRFRHVQPAVGREAVEQRRRERDAAPSRRVVTPRVVVTNCMRRPRARRAASDRRHVGLRLAADVLPRRPPSSPRPRARPPIASAAQREQRRPRSRQAAAERAGIDGRPLDLRQARHERRAPRFGDRVLERSRQQIEVAGVQRVRRARRDSPTA